MISTQRSGVPEYLRISPHFHNLFDDCEEDSQTIDIPADCLKANADIESAIDLRDLLHTVRFWLVPEIIEENASLFAFAYLDVAAFQQIADEYDKDFPFLMKLSTALQGSGKLTVMGGAAKFGLLGLVKHLHSKGVSWETGACMHFTALAAKHGHLDCLRFAVENKCRPTLDTCIEAAAEGHLDCLNYAYVNAAPVNMKVFEAAVRAGHLPCVKYIVSQDVLGDGEIGRFCDSAARAGNLDVLKYLIDAGCVPSVDTANAAAAYDHLHCLKLLHHVGCPITSETSFTAVQCGGLQCLEFLNSVGCGWDPATIQLQLFNSVARARDAYYETFPANKVMCTYMYAVEHGCPVTAKSMFLAVSLGSAEFVKCLHDRGLELDALAFRTAVTQGKVECMQYFLAHGFPAGTECILEAVRSNRLESVRCLHEHGVAWDATVTSLAVQLNKSVVLQYLLQHGCPFEGGAIVQAAGRHHIACLKYLHEFGAVLTEEEVSAACQLIATQCLDYALSKGCPFREDDCIQAAARGNLSCLKCLHNHGAPMTAAIVTAALEKGYFTSVDFAITHASTDLGPVACSAAATRKSTAFLKKLHEQGFSWDIETCLSAVRSDSFECLKYAVKNACPFDESALQAEAALHGRRDMIKWLHCKRVPWDARTTAAAVQSDNVLCLKYAVQRHCPYDVMTEVLEKSPSCEGYMKERGHDIIKRALLRQEL